MHSLVSLISLLIVLTFVIADAVADFGHLQSQLQAVASQILTTITTPNSAAADPGNVTYGSYPMAYGSDYVSCLWCYVFLLMLSAYIFFGPKHHRHCRRIYGKLPSRSGTTSLSN